MWTWLGIAVLARVLMASHEVDQYQSTSSISDELTEDGNTEGESSAAGEELSRQLGLGFSKPEISKSRSLQLEWKKKKIFQDINPYENSISNLIGELSTSGSKIPKNNEKEIDDERDKRSSAKQGEPVPSGSWMSWMTLENKAVPFRNLEDPWQEIKKSRAFSPWGGKRVTSFSQGPKVHRPIRVPFNSWGGKRSYSEELEKRGRFSSWGGKRGWYIGAEDDSKNGMEKRTKFNAWGGKRSKNGERDDEEIKRNRFNAWGGKRSENSDKRNPEEVGAKKSVFNAWGGKRFFTSDEVNQLVDEKGFNGGGRNMLNDQKPGDRSIELEDSVSNNQLNENGADDDDNEIPLESEIIELQEKRGFGGRGGGGGGRGSQDYLHKSLFNPWGGKKRGENDLDEIGRGLNLILPESHHHHTRFWPWGG